MIFKFVMGRIITGGKHGGNVNVSNGNITHPPYGSGKKSPKVKVKMKMERGKK
jgi:hypothetical protein